LGFIEYDAWGTEAFQRNIPYCACDLMDEEDLLTISDADEIVKMSVIQELQAPNCVRKPIGFHLATNDLHLNYQLVEPQ
jgi:hypothetical protein